MSIAPERELDTRVYVPGNGGAFAVSVAFDGTNHLAVWQGGSANRIRATRVSPQGLVLDPNQIDLGEGQQPSVAFGDGKFRVAWIDYQTGALKYARVLPDGTALDPNGIVAVTAANAYPGGDPQIAHTPGTSLIVWSTSGKTLRAARVLESGVPLDATAPLLIATQPAPVSFDFHVAASATQFLVTWEESGGSTRATRVSTAGALLDLGGILLGPVLRPSVGSNGSDFLVVTGDNTGLAARRISAAGQLFMPEPIVVAPFAGHSAIGHDGTNYFVAWQDGSNPSTIRSSRVSTAGLLLNTEAAAVGSSPRLRVSCSLGQCLFGFTLQGLPSAVRISDAGTALDPAPFPLSVRVNSQQNPAAVWTGMHFVVAWEDDRGGSWATRIFPDGGVVDDPAVFIGDVSGSALASNGTDVLVAAADDALRPVVLLLDPDLQPRGPPRLLSTQSALRSFAAASVAGDFLVAWPVGNQRRLTRIAADGGFLDPDGGIPLPGINLENLRIVATGANYLVSWDESVHPARRWLVTRMTPAGAFLEAPYTPISGVEVARLVEFDGTNFLAVWGVIGGANVGRFSPTGVSFDGTGIAVQQSVGTGAPTLEAPLLAFDGTYQLLFFHPASPHPYQLARFTTDAGQVGAQPVPSFAMSVLDQHALASDRAGHSLLVRTLALSGNLTRVVAQMIDTHPSGLGSACGGDSDCTTGQCVDGVCCDTPCAGGTSDCLACSIAAGGQTDGVCGPSRALVLCRAAAGICDVAERCDGTSVACPAEQVLDAGTLCRPKSPFQACDLPELCDGVQPDCPANVTLPMGTKCDDGSFCTVDDRCQGGQCRGTPLPMESACSTGTPCLGTGVCRGNPGQCIEFPVPCPPRPCWVGTCSADAGGCSYVPLGDGLACPGGYGTCVGGTCIPPEAPPDPDAGTADAGPRPPPAKSDAGTGMTEPPRACGCSSGAAPLGLGALVLLLGRRRTRARRGHARDEADAPFRRAA